jgi:hypothetical protein
MGSVVPSTVGFQVSRAVTEALTAQSRLVVVRGASGLGKSATLSHLAESLAERGRDVRQVYVPAHEPRPVLTVPSRGTLLVDEANRLRPGEIVRLLGCCRERSCLLVLGTHRPDDWWLGRLCPVRTVALRRWRDPGLVEAVVRARLAYLQVAALQFQAEPAIWPAALAAGHGIPRQVLRFLYWLFEMSASPASLRAPDLPAAREAYCRFEPTPRSFPQRLGELLPA